MGEGRAIALPPGHHSLRPSPTHAPTVLLSPSPYVEPPPVLRSRKSFRGVPSCQRHLLLSRSSKRPEASLVGSKVLNVLPLGAGAFEGWELCTWYGGEGVC